MFTPVFSPVFFWCVVIGVTICVLAISGCSRDRGGIAILVVILMLIIVFNWNHIAWFGFFNAPQDVTLPHYNISVPHPPSPPSPSRK